MRFGPDTLSAPLPRRKHALWRRMAHLLCVLILIARIGDVVSTRLVTPTLRLEANPIARRLGWRFAILTLLACLIPYYNTALGFTALITFLFVCFWNWSRMWLARTMGEEAFETLILEMARRSSLSRALLPSAIGFISLASIGILLLVSSGGTEHWAFWGSLGLLVGCASVFIFQALFFIRLFARTRSRESVQPQE